jgi:hypothetical protein
MFEEMLQVIAAVFVLFTLIVAFTHVATHHSSMATIRSNGLDIRTEEYH